MAGPHGERCIDCIKYDPSKMVCRARAPMPQIGLENERYTLILPSVMPDDYCVNDFVKEQINVKGSA